MSMKIVSSFKKLFGLNKKQEEDLPSIGNSQADSNSDERIRSLIDKCKELSSLLEGKEKEVDELQRKLLAGSVDGSSELLEKIKEENAAQVKKLKREIDDLQDELDEAESDLKKAKRTVEEQTSQKIALEDEVRKLKNEISNISSELDLSKEELKETSSQLSLTSDSLDFVEEILTASAIQCESLSLKWQKISAVSSFILNDFQDLVKQYFNHSETQDYIFGVGLSQWVATKRKSWIEGKKTIAFIGEFSAGKTSIVNRILSQDNSNIALLPVSTKATTAVPTYIAGGDYTTYQFVSPDGTLKGISENTFKKVSKEILGRINGVSSLISYFVMTYNNPHLEGLSILDTPGFSSGDQEDAIRTIDVINECDALFWVFDVNAGTVNRSSLKIIKENMTRPLYVIINKVDTKSKSDVDSVEKLIRKAFDKEGIKVEKFLRFSSKEAIDGLMNEIQSVENDNSAQRYISLLMDEYLPSLIDAYEEESKKAHQELKCSNDKCDAQWTQIINLCRRIQDDSYEAAGIPHWEKHFFGKDRYEMNESQGNRLINLLNTISDKEIVHLVELIEEDEEIVKENQKCQSNASEHNYTVRQFNDCREKLAKLLKEFNY